jgi:hypothetical protein
MRITPHIPIRVCTVPPAGNSSAATSRRRIRAGEGAGHVVQISFFMSSRRDDHGLPTAGFARNPIELQRRKGRKRRGKTRGDILPYRTNHVGCPTSRFPGPKMGGPKMGRKPIPSESYVRAVLSVAHWGFWRTIQGRRPVTAFRLQVPPKVIVRPPPLRIPDNWRPKRRSPTSWSRQRMPPT